MSTRTPLSNVQGLGSAKSGVEHFWRQRATAAALIPLSLWFIFAVFHLIGQPQATVVAFIANPVHAILLGLFVIAVLIHMILGVQVVIEDYITAEGSKLLTLLLAKALTWLVGAACLFAIIKIAI